jgi:hypothetical protein
LTRWPGSRLALLTALLIAACSASGCVTSFGPGYLVEKQSINVSYAGDAAGRVAVRASYQLKNNGTTPLEAIDVELPAGESFAAQGLQVTWRDKNIPMQSATTVEGPASIPLPEKWGTGDSGELVIAYGLKTAPSADGSSGAPNFFLLPTMSWYPFIVSPPGYFASGGSPPQKWDLVVSVPEGFRIHASGASHGRAHEKKDAQPGLLYEQIPGRDFAPFIAAGSFSQREIQASGRTVFFWTMQPLADDRASQIGKQIAADALFFRTQFGALRSEYHATWVIECPLANSLSDFSDPFATPNCPTVPESVILPEGALDHAAPSDLMPVADRQIAASWFALSVVTAEGDPPYPLAAAPDYAVFSLNETRSPSARDSTIRAFLRRATAGAPPNEKPLIAVKPDDPRDVRDRALAHSELFFIALEDTCGAENLHRGMARVVRVLRGQNWRVVDLRSALETACGRDFAGFFREWLNLAAIPDDFLARYGGSPAAKTSPSNLEPPFDFRR